MYASIGLAVVILLAFAALYKFTAFFAWHLNKYRTRRIRNVVYMTGSANPRHKLDVYLPLHETSFPVVVFIHGGYWNSGDKEHRQWLTGLYGNIGCSLATRGVGVVIPNYRLVPLNSIDDQLSDVANAVRWTTKQIPGWGGNGDIFVIGHSSGSHVASLLCANPEPYGINSLSNIRGYAALSPILDIPSMVETHDDTFNQKVTYPTFGKDKQGWESYSPMYHFIHNKMSPDTRLLLAYGEKDFSYIATKTPEWYKTLKDSGIDVTLSALAGYNHTDMVVKFGHNNDQLAKQIVAFITTK